ncbi:hypothetical protein [Erythrobacter sp. QSSC1-22B]|uniref:hypothetical protein n=1 Tax=Erythrobacter sp. QSSC1-22B TaxID=1860125 RepID=UPI0011A4DC3F|nr:hypothetical protein [Erythrobacter sp. QSSC1-22B]
MANGGKFAHQLRNSTQVVLGNLELLASRVKDPSCIRFIDNAQSAVVEISVVADKIEDADDTDQSPR